MGAVSDVPSKDAPDHHKPMDYVVHMEVVDDAMRKVAPRVLNVDLTVQCMVDL